MVLTGASLCCLFSAGFLLLVFQRGVALCGTVPVWESLSLSCLEEQQSCSPLHLSVCHSLSMLPLFSSPGCSPSSPPPPSLFEQTRPSGGHPTSWVDLLLSSLSQLWRLFLRFLSFSVTCQPLPKWIPNQTSYLWSKWKLIPSTWSSASSSSKLAGPRGCGHHHQHHRGH